MDNEFTTAGFRFGHSLLTSELPLVNRQGNIVRNFTLDDTTAFVDVIDNSGGTNEISPGVSLGLLDISSNDFNTILQIDLQVPFPGFATTFSTANDPEFAFLRSENFTINGVNPNDDDMGVVPLPAALPLFLGGLAIFGLFARRRAA